MEERSLRQKIKERIAEGIRTGSGELTFHGGWGTLTRLPESLRRWTGLKRLHLSCDFADLPEDIGRLGHLEEIRLFGTHEIAGLPERLEAIPSLKRLNIDWGGYCVLSVPPKRKPSPSIRWRQQ